MSKCIYCDGKGRYPSNGNGDQAGGWAETCEECNGTGTTPAPVYRTDLVAYAILDATDSPKFTQLLDELNVEGDQYSNAMLLIAAAAQRLIGKGDIVYTTGRWVNNERFVSGPFPGQIFLVVTDKFPDELGVLVEREVFLNAEGFDSWEAVRLRWIQNASMSLSDPQNFPTEPEVFAQEAAEFGCPCTPEQVERMTAFVRGFLG